MIDRSIVPIESFTLLEEDKVRQNLFWFFSYKNPEETNIESLLVLMKSLDIQITFPRNQRGDWLQQYPKQKHPFCTEEKTENLLFWYLNEKPVIPNGPKTVIKFVHLLEFRIVFLVFAGFVSTNKVPTKLSTSYKKQIDSCIRALRVLTFRKRCWNFFITLAIQTYFHPPP